MKIYTILSVTQTLYMKAENTDAVVSLLSKQGFERIPNNEPLNVSKKQYHIF